MEIEEKSEGDSEISFDCGIRDCIQNFAGYEIQNEQTSCGIRDAGLQDAGNDLIFSWDTESIHLIRVPYG